MPIKIGLIGNDGRTTAIESTLNRRGAEVSVFYLSPWKGPGATDNPREQVRARALEMRPDFVVVGPEEPLAEGIVDMLQDELGIPCIGPTQELAQLEASKAFTRALLEEFKIEGNPKYRVFRSNDGIADWINSLDGYVVKPDGLTGGKGVQVSDVHLFNLQQALEYCESILNSHSSVMVEEKLDGEEFSLMSFCDGDHIVDMVPVQDHKRRFEGDLGPNTGGMGSYSCEDHSLPFLSGEILEQASAINAEVGRALKKKTGKPYKGILYGGFMITSKGLRLLEYNARFGDPETMNVLSVLETDLVEIFQAMIDGTLDQTDVRFAKKATVCKYIVPEGYPDHPISNAKIDLSSVPPDSDRIKSFNAAIEKRGDGVYLTGSRAIAFVGIGADLHEAEIIAEAAASAVVGPVAHRKDIGTDALIQRRIQHVHALNGMRG
jgi:phosphoribosylamine--glycine ligase